MAKPQITISRLNIKKVQREKAKNRRAIQAASPAQREAMQHTHSIVGYNKADLTYDFRQAGKGF